VRKAIVLLVLTAMVFGGVVWNHETTEAQNGFPLPEFELPYYEDTGPYWSGGPHQWGVGPDVKWMDLYAGSGLDFAYGGETFPVATMAEGDVIFAGDADNGLGTQVAVRHAVGGSVLIYGHLASIDRKILDGMAENGTLRVYPADQIGLAGKTGGQKRVHLHIELRDGSDGCCGSGYNGGGPISWHSTVLNGYMIFDFRPNELGIIDDPGWREVAYNYDGAAVKLSELQADFRVVPFENFAFQDYTGEIREHVYTMLPADFECGPMEPEDEECGEHPSVIFAGHGHFGGGGILISDLAPPGGDGSSGILEFEVTTHGNDAWPEIVLSDDGYPMISEVNIYIHIVLPADTSSVVSIRNLDTGATAYLFGIRPGERREAIESYDLTQPVLASDSHVEICALVYDSKEQNITSGLCTTVIPIPGRGCLKDTAEGGKGCWSLYLATQLEYHSAEGYSWLNYPAYKMPVNVSVGQRARITEGDPNKLRATPCTDDTYCPQIGTIPGLSEFDILGGPVYADGYPWWQVYYWDGTNWTTGWTAGGDGTEYWIEPVP